MDTSVISDSGSIGTVLAESMESVVNGAASVADGFAVADAVITAADAAIKATGAATKAAAKKAGSKVADALNKARGREAASKSPQTAKGQVKSGQSVSIQTDQPVQRPSTLPILSEPIKRIRPMSVRDPEDFDVVGCGSQCIDFCPNECYQPHWPNQILATTYAINKSASKSVKVGLEFDGEQFKEVVYITGTCGKPVRMQKKNWTSLTDASDIINAYFNAEPLFADYGNPAKIYLCGVDVVFTTSYGKKSITIEERPLPWCEEENGKSARRKRKFDSPPSITLQSISVAGLLKLEECISRQINKLAGGVRICESILKRMMQFTADNQLTLEDLEDLLGFRKFFHFKKKELEKYLDDTAEEDGRPTNGESGIILLEMVNFSEDGLMKYLKNHLFNFSEKLDEKK